MMSVQSHATETTLPCRRGWRWREILVLVGTFLIGGGLGAQEASGPEKAEASETSQSAAAGEIPETGILLVSQASSPKVYAPIQGAKSTVLAPAYQDKYGVRLYSREVWQEKELVWNTVYAAAIKQADTLVDALEPEFKRDTRGVIDYAVIQHESPWLSSVLLSRRFLPRFEREFGGRLYVMVIGRHRIFVFPADGGELGSYAPALADLYHDESAIRHPVSLEIFLVDESGFRVVGTIED